MINLNAITPQEAYSILIFGGASFLFFIGVPIWLFVHEYIKVAKSQYQLNPLSQIFKSFFYAMAWIIFMIIVFVFIGMAFYSLQGENLMGYGIYNFWNNDWINLDLSKFTEASEVYKNWGEEEYNAVKFVLLFIQYLAIFTSISIVSLFFVVFFFSFSSLKYQVAQGADDTKIRNIALILMILIFGFTLSWIVLGTAEHGLEGILKGINRISGSGDTKDDVDILLNIKSFIKASQL